MNMDKPKHDKTRDAGRINYGKIALANGVGCGCASITCCGAPNDTSAADISLKLGYTAEEMSGVQKGANLGLGCGNPLASAGFDCFLAARAVGESGLVIGVDMTPEMFVKARENAGKSGFDNIEFRLGELENLPVADGIIDVIISNCVINKGIIDENENTFSLYRQFLPQPDG